MFQCFYFLVYSHFCFLFSACSSWLILFFPVPPLIHICQFRLFSYSFFCSDASYIPQFRRSSCTSVFYLDGPPISLSYQTLLYIYPFISSDAPSIHVPMGRRPLPAVRDFTRDGRWSTYYVSVCKKMGGGGGYAQRQDTHPLKLPFLLYNCLCSKASSVPLWLLEPPFLPFVGSVQMISFLLITFWRNIYFILKDKKS